MSNSQDHESVWHNDVYRAWYDKYGSPENYAAKIKKKPEKILGSLLSEFDFIDRAHILNPLGSIGSKALALSLLGASVTIVDFSHDNEKYFNDLNASLHQEVTYLVQNVMTLDFHEEFDYAFSEMGILHYFEDLVAFFSIYYKALKPGGKIIIRDFHPVSTKLITSRGSTAKVRKHKVTGDYFATDWVEKESATSKYSSDSSRHLIQLRQWTLGEIVTAMATCGFIIEHLIEEPNLSSEVFDKGIPKTFILKARKAK